MKSYDASNIRNIAIAGHTGKGKTTLAEAMLFLAKATDRLGKVSDGNNGYVYTIPEEESFSENDQIYAQDFLRGYISIDFSGNICVIKTLGGYAHSVTNALDSMNIEEILGTIAGENCIFVCLREGVAGREFLSRLKEKIPELEV